MRKLPLNRLCWLALRASTALALTIAPYHLTFDGVANIGAASAYAKGGEGSGGGDGGGGDGGGDHDGGDHDGGDHDGGDHDGGDNDGGDDHGGGDNSGPGGGDDADGDDNGHDSSEHVNPTTGDKVEVDGDKIEVTHPDGTREEIENGRFEMKDALGRTIVERPATAADVARLQGL